jgi:hypothetical protein
MKMFPPLCNGMEILMALDIDAPEMVTMFFETDRVRQPPVRFGNYRQAIISIMETVAVEDQKTAVICGRWHTMEYREVARRYANIEAAHDTNTSNASVFELLAQSLYEPRQSLYLPSRTV